MHRQKVISKGKYLYSQKIGAVTVDSYVVFEENGNKFLLLRLLNGRAETLDGLTLKVTQYDAAGKAISSEHYCFDGKEYGANSRFVPDKKIPLGKDCAEFRANVLSATYGNYRYIASAEGVTVDYVPKKQQNTFDTSDKLKGMKGQRLAVKSSKLRMSLVLGLFAIVMTAGICALGFFNLDYFKETATGFMKDGVEYRFIDGDKSRNGKLAVAGYSGTSGAVNIPSVIKGYPVISVDSRAFMNNDGITYVSFGGDITIEDEAFCNCTSLNFVDFEDVVFVGDNAFNNCTNLLELNSQTLSHIGLNAFSGCYSLMGVEIGGEGSVYIGERAFSGCGNLSSVTIDKNIEFEYSDGVFSACDSLESLSFANFYATELTVAELFGSGVCPLRELKIGELNALNDGFCKGMDALESVEILKLSDEKVGDYAFADCTNLRDVSLGGEIFEIGNYAFENCRKLSDFTISDDVFRIGDYAFSECTNLRLSYLPESLTEIGQFAFSGCGNVSISSIPDGVTSIGDYAFSNCYSITSLTIPDSVLSMGLGMLEGCNLLESLTTPFVGRTRDDNSFIAYTFGIFDAAATNIPYSLASVTLTDSKFIPDYAFANCSGISKIIIDCPISYIGSSAFSGCGGLSSLELSAGLEEIGEYAFANCYSLESLEIPDSVKTIGLGALSGCSSLNSLTTPFVGLSRDGNAFLAYMFGSMNINSGYMVPDSLNTVAVTDSDVLSESAFYGCSFIKSIVLGDGMTQIGRCAFSGCNALTDIVVPDTVTSFGDEAFRGCNSLHSIELPLLLTEIGAYMFDGCINLSTVELSPDLVSIGEYAFADCSSLEMLEIPQSVQYIGFSVFSGCNSLNSLTTPFVGFSRDENAFLSYMFGSMDSYSGYVVPYLLKTVEVTDSDVLGDSAFYGCSNIKSVKLCDGMTQIGRGAFSGCNALTDIVIPDTVTSVGDNAFNWCNSLRSIELPRQLAEIGAYVFDSCLNLSEVELSPDLASIGEYAFANCSSLESLEIPDSVNTIGLGALSGCSSLNSLTTPFVGYSRDSNAFIAYMFGGTDMYTSYYIPYSLESVEITDSYSLGECAFYGCNDIKTVTLNEEIESIGTSAFSGCGSLVSLQIPENVTRIGDSAFYGCYELTTIEFPAAVTDLGDQVLYDCIKLTSLKLPENLASIGEYAFANCSSLESLEIPDSVNTIGLGALSGCSSLNSLTTPFVGYSRDSNAFIAYMFGGTDMYTSYYIPYSLESVEITDSYLLGECAFYGCNDIKTVALNEEIESIGTSAFSGCGSLVSLQIPKNVTRIGDSAFYGCYELTTIEFPAAVTDLGDQVLYDCIKLTSLKLPENLASIGEYAFANCYSLETLQIPESVQYIGFSALSRCNLLNSLTTPFVGYSRNQNAFLAYMFGGTEIYSNYMVPETLTAVEITDSDAIAAGAFNNCYRIESITLNEGIAAIENNAFYGCVSLESIELPEGLTYVGMNAFGSCNYLRSIRLPSTLLSIDDNAFSNCYRLYSVFNDSSLNLTCGMSDYGNVAQYAYKIYSYGEEAQVAEENGYEFSHFDDGWYVVAVPDDLVSADLPSSFAFGGAVIDEYKIPHYLFYHEEVLEGVYIPDSVRSIGEQAFSNCNSLIRAEFSQTSPVTEIPFQAFAYSNKLTELVLPSGLETIGDMAFINCISLKDFTVGAEISQIGNEAFSYCYRLLEIYNYSQLGIVAGSTDYGNIARYAMVVYGTDGESEVEFVTVDGLEFAVRGGEWYLVGCDDGISELRLEAFDYEGHHIDSFSVYPYAFIQNMQLTSVYIGDAVTSIGESAFSNCTNLTEVVFDNTRITRIEDAAFEYCYSLVTLVLPENVQEIGENAFRNNMIAELELPDSLRVIEGYAFTNTYIVQLELPSSVESLGNYAFAYCYELVVVTLNSDADIGQDAFMGDDIKIVNNFSNLEIVAGDWNNGGIAINAIYVNTDPSEETYVYKTDGYTFAFIEGEWVLIDYNGYYQTVMIPESFVFEDNEVSSFAIAGGAFRYATIAYLVIPESVSSIAEGAFYMCNITYVCYKGTAEEWEQLYAEGCGLESVTVLYYADCVHDTGSWTYDEYGNLVMGVYYHSEITKEATCTEEGEMSDVCDVCGEVIRTYPYDKLPHSPDSDGMCAVCGAQGEVVGAGGYLPSYITDDAVYPFAVGTDGTLTMTGTAPGSSSTLILTAEKDMEVYISMNLSSEIYAEIQIEGAGYGYGGGYYTNQFTLKEGEQLTLICGVNFFAQSDGEMSFSIILFEI